MFPFLFQRIYILHNVKSADIPPFVNVVCSIINFTVRNLWIFLHIH